MKYKILVFLSSLSISLCGASSYMTDDGEANSSVPQAPSALGARDLPTHDRPMQRIMSIINGEMKRSKSAMGLFAHYDKEELPIGTALYLGQDEDNRHIALAPARSILLSCGPDISLFLHTPDDSGDGSNAQKYEVAVHSVHPYYLKANLSPMLNVAFLSFDLGDHPDIKHAFLGDTKTSYPVDIRAMGFFLTIPQPTVFDIQTMRYNTEVKRLETRLIETHARRVKSEVALEYYDNGENLESLLDTYRTELNKANTDLQKCDREIQHLNTKIQKLPTGDESFDEIGFKIKILLRIKTFLFITQNDLKQKITHLETGDINFTKGKTYWLSFFSTTTKIIYKFLKEKQLSVLTQRAFLKNYKQNIGAHAKLNTDSTTYSARLKQWNDRSLYLQNACMAEEKGSKEVIRAFWEKLKDVAKKRAHLRRNYHIFLGRHNELRAHYLLKKQQANKHHKVRLAQHTAEHAQRKAERVKKNPMLVKKKRQPTKRMGRTSQN